MLSKGEHLRPSNRLTDGHCQNHPSLSRLVRPPTILDNGLTHRYKSDLRQHITLIYVRRRCRRVCIEWKLGINFLGAKDCRLFYSRAVNRMSSTVPF